MAEYISSSYVVGSFHSGHLYIPVILGGLNNSIRATAMVDSGATCLFMNRRYAERSRMLLHELPCPIYVRNIDGTPNQAGAMTHSVRVQLTTGDYKEWVEFLITDLSAEDMILGLPWLRRVNPEIDWETGRVGVKEEVTDYEIGVDDDGGEGEEETVYKINASRTIHKYWVKDGITDTVTDEVWCAASYTHSQCIAEEAAKAKSEAPKTFEEIVPEPYRGFKKGLLGGRKSVIARTPALGSQDQFEARRSRYATVKGVPYVVQ